LLADEIVAEAHDLAGEVGDHVGVEVAVRDNCARVNGLHYHLEIFTGRQDRRLPFRRPERGQLATFTEGS
jgi:hypothetical protein